MSEKMTNSVQELIDRIKELKGLKTDKQVALELGMKRTALAERKRRDSLPKDELWDFARREGFSLTYLIYGEGSKLEDESVEYELPFWDEAKKIPKWSYPRGAFIYLKAIESCGIKPNQIFLDEEAIKRAKPPCVERYVRREINEEILFEAAKDETRKWFDVFQLSANPSLSQDPKIASLLDMAREVLLSETYYATILEINIRAFHMSVTGKPAEGDPNNQDPPDPHDPESSAETGT